MAPALALAQALPADIQDHIRKLYGDEVRYVEAAFDLDGDSRAERLVHVVGPMACGSGGCPTLVFTPAASGHRLVSAITVSHPPIKVSSQRSSGWQNLIVQVGGGGVKPGAVELAFDGKSYPTNPTTKDPRITPVDEKSGRELIKPVASFEDAKPLGPKTSVAAIPPPPPMITEPSFDCAKSTATVEKLICGDDDLAKLDRALGASYEKLFAKLSESDRQKERGEQSAWIEHRNACSKTKDVRACLETSYRQRQVQVRIRGGEFPAPTPVAYECKGREQDPLTVAFYNKTEPPSAVITLGDKQTIAFATKSASGARYSSSQIDFWEHQGEARVKWSGASYVCKVRRS
jgi:uncharacterized protein